MADFKVTQILSSREWSPPDKPDQKTIFYDFKAEGQEKVCTVGRKPGNELKVGDVISGTATEDRGKLKIKATPKGFGGGGFRGKTPEERRAEDYRSALHCAAGYAIGLAQAGLLPENWKSDNVDALAKRWFRNIEAASKGEL